MTQTPDHMPDHEAVDNRVTSYPQARRARVRGRPRRFVRLLLNGVAALIILSVLGVATLLGLLWGEHRSAITLPTPTGPFPVGRALYDWVDNSRIDSLAPVAGQKRELMVWIWYPATATQASKVVDYLPAPWQTALAHYQGIVFNTFLARDPSQVHVHSVSPAAVSSA